MKKPSTSGATVLGALLLFAVAGGVAHSGTLDIECGHGVVCPEGNTDNAPVMNFGNEGQISKYDYSEPDDEEEEGIPLDVIKEELGVEDPAAHFGVTAAGCVYAGKTYDDGYILRIPAGARWDNPNHERHIRGRALSAVAMMCDSDGGGYFWGVLGGRYREF